EAHWRGHSISTDSHQASVRRQPGQSAGHGTGGATDPPAADQRVHVDRRRTRSSGDARSRIDVWDAIGAPARQPPQDRMTTPGRAAPILETDLAADRYRFGGRLSVLFPSQVLIDVT